MKRRFLVGAVGVALACSGAAALAQSWPTQPVRMVVPYPPGGANDVVARIYALHLQQALGQPVVIENKAGAGGQIGAESVARAAPDGYTVLFGAIGSLAIHAVIPSQKPPYELSKAFVGVSMGASVPLALAVRQGLKVADVKALADAAREKPGKLTYGSAGNGSTQHMTAEYFRQRTSTDLVHVPYKGSAPAVNDLLGGQIDLVFETLPALSSQMSSDKIRLLAVTSRQRVPGLPEVPTVDEMGVKDFEVVTMYGLLAPSGTPKDIVERLSSAMRTIGARPDVKAQLAKQGAEVKTSTPNETDQLLRQEVEKWSVVARNAKLE
ncbi:Bug family tripartite tricarboxylate transporter substrate binding protein [Pseudorhodoferax soli]|uniref:Tripartite-type tricarboxylate transporter receptor subunit TctC n=1 Tax=Pseudorhodoferax soli TaxID=545864 RepID=A0A368X9V9_9BURK|nr:tripartite tricarboxylate transporter substrate binding protein [Pseudorhodoferax soli]RCW63227.1 tripartite-type tricarboxylate transporter receptor subunit TctC [Pseudorhodoferax soli]